MVAPASIAQGTNELVDSKVSGVSWGAILAGAASAAALSLVFLLLGTGLGFSVVSPWQNHGIGAKALGVSAIVWLAFTQVVASGLGGYLAGRLRVKSTGIHRNEIHFRDTAHGLLAWSVASLVVAAITVTGLGNLAGKSADMGASVVSGIAGAAGSTLAETAAPRDGTPLSYYVNALFRPNAAPSRHPEAAANTEENTEIAGILASSIKAGTLSAEDRNYLGQVVARHTGLSAEEADARVDTIYSRVSKAASDAMAATQQAADSARKAIAFSALWMVVALLSGAFVASLAALWGGMARNHSPVPARKPLTPAA